MSRLEPAIERFGAYLKRRHYAAETLTNYTLDLQLFFANHEGPPATVTHLDIERFLQHQHEKALEPTTINRRLYALKHFFDFLLEQQEVFGNPVKASHFCRVGRPLPRALSSEQVQALFAKLKHPMDKALFMVILRGGLRVSEIVNLKCDHLDWQQNSLRVEQGKGKKDRQVFLSTDAAESLRAALALRPGGVPKDAVFWNRKRPQRPLTIKAIQKKIERLAKAAGVEATCHQLRHTFASNLLEHGAELVTVKELLGHESMATSERYARVSNQRVKQEYQRTMRKVLRTVKV